MRIAIFFGSTSGNTADAAKRIRMVLRHHQPVHLYDISECTDATVFESYDLLLWGTSTWGEGELQVDWERFLPCFDSISLEGKKVALFGQGDQKYFGHVFVNGLRVLYDKALECGATVIGLWPDKGYQYEETVSVIHGNFVGLVLDDDNQEELTEKRILLWCRQLMIELMQKPSFEMIQE